ncbi:MAG: hypothetical protein A4E64_01235 [Syntrophorhabdus sp. PtaU1.Bin058]|nr:MAG: hypothetical protein A4E64_01235 [Syntrophorhabdus sp. PtaU1.Bin058]
MNKRANKKAFFICVLIGLMYVSVAMKLPDRFTIGRTSETGNAVPTGMSVSIPKPAPVNIPAPANTPKTGQVIEPSYFVAIPIVCFAIRKGLIEKEGLVFIRKDAQDNAYCKKPMDILQDRDEEGLKSIAKIIGKKQLIAFFKKEGAALREELDPQDVILGKGYVIEEDIILSMYNRNVPEDYNKLFPYIIHTTEIRREGDRFAFRHVSDTVKTYSDNNQNEWTMPSLVNLPMKAALEKLATRTSKIKIYGSGLVTEQQPKAFEKVKGETECIIRGRPYR